MEKFSKLVKDNKAINVKKLIETLIISRYGLAEAQGS